MRQFNRFFRFILNVQAAVVEGFEINGSPVFGVGHGSGGSRVIPPAQRKTIEINACALWKPKALLATIRIFALMPSTIPLVSLSLM